MAPCPGASRASYPAGLPPLPVTRRLRACFVDSPSQPELKTLPKAPFSRWRSRLDDCSAGELSHAVGFWREVMRDPANAVGLPVPYPRYREEDAALRDTWRTMVLFGRHGEWRKADSRRALCGGSSAGFPFSADDMTLARGGGSISLRSGPLEVARLWLDWM